MKDKLHNLFNWTINIAFGLILVCLVIGICIGALQLIGSIAQLMRFDGVTGKYIDMISDVLTLYVLIELSRSLIEFFDSRRLRLSLIIDAAIVFIVREILIGLFKHELKPEMIYALSVLILVLGVVRIGSFFASKNSPLLKAPQHPKADTPDELPGKPS